MPQFNSTQAALDSIDSLPEDLLVADKVPFTVLDKFHITNDEETTDEVEYPDGGLQAWLVVIGSFVAHFLVLGNVYSFGIFNSFYADIGVGSAAEVALIGSIGIASIYILGILSSTLAERLGFRQVIFSGILLLSSGLFLASFTTSLPILILTQGLMFGIGSCFVYFPSVSLPSQWFLKKRGLAMGIAVSGSGLGGLVFSILSQRLLDTLGREWTLRVTAIICLVLMSIFVPFMKTRIPPRKGKAGMSFLKNPGFYCLLFACFFGAFCEFVPVYFLTIYGQDKLGLTKADGSVILSVYNGFNMIGRLALGLASDKLGPMNSMMACTWLTVVCIFSWLATTSFGGVCALSAAIGFFDGGFWTLFPIAVVELCGADGTLINMMAILYTFMTIAVFGTPPLSGFIKDAWGLDWMIVYAGGLAILAALASTGARFVHARGRH